MGFVERDRCPGCDSTSGRTLLLLPYDVDPVREYLLQFYGRQGHADLDRVSGQDYRLDRCDSCGLVFQRSVPDDELLHEIYEEWIDPDLVAKTELAERDVDYFSVHAREVERVLRFLGRSPQSTRLLDFGMGWAEWARMGLAYGCEVWGTELSPARRAHAASHGVRVLDDLADQQFDVINTEQVFEHLTRPREVLAALVRALAPEGLLKISVPNGWDIQRRLAVGDWQAPLESPDSLNPVAPLEHVNCYTLAAMDAMARSFGLERVDLRLNLASRRQLLDLSLGDVLRPARATVRRLSTRGAMQPTYAFYRHA